MLRAGRFPGLLLCGLGLLAVLGYEVMARTTMRWFEADVAMRSQLAVAAARQGLVSNWHAGPARLTNLLADITRDERVMAASACSAAGQLLAVTQSFPAAFSCRPLIERMSRNASPSVHQWSFTHELPSGRSRQRDEVDEPRPAARRDRAGCAP